MMNGRENPDAKREIPSDLGDELRNVLAKRSRLQAETEANKAPSSENSAQAANQDITPAQHTIQEFNQPDTQRGNEKSVQAVGTTVVPGTNIPPASSTAVAVIANSAAQPSNFPLVETSQAIKENARLQLKLADQTKLMAQQNQLFLQLEQRLAVLAGDLQQSNTTRDQALKAARRFKDELTTSRESVQQLQQRTTSLQEALAQQQEHHTTQLIAAHEQSRAEERARITAQVGPALQQAYDKGIADTRAKVTAEVTAEAEQAIRQAYEKGLAERNRHVQPTQPLSTAGSALFSQPPVTTDQGSSSSNLAQTNGHTPASDAYDQ